MGGQYFTHQQQPDIPLEYAKQSQVSFFCVLERENNLVHIS